MVLANAAAVWIGIIYLFCGLAIAVFPEISRSVSQSWFHGIDIGKIWSAVPFPGSFLLGFVSSMLLTWAAAYLFAFFYNFFLGKK